ncbi:hypothetical protein [Psychromonas sp. GE-S-Ul-11]|uniref:hypothetical protein n=1 Tax=unclassified Psychromonas TaxID=2614957 RepID=UPI00390C768E
MSESKNDNALQLTQLITPLNAMHLAQLTAFSFGLPPLYFCREYQSLTSDTIKKQCEERLLKQLNNEQITVQELQQLLLDKEYFDEEEAGLRVAPLTEE